MQANFKSSTLALFSPPCHWPVMGDRKETSQAGGSLLAFSIIGGTVAGVILGQPSIGFLAGTGIGLLLLGLVWLKNRR